ncbi:MAG: MotA/TolQ/ExbB proton channel family protein [Parasphingorhabdus sp.]|uniref:MotA/TolQ/ExbB proton channel family protein n=1 Tax=Parasphingorhabdus sp. TaxID=2709688 RepID=UPI003002502E
MVELFDPLVLAMVWLSAIAVVGLQEGYAGLLRSFSAWKILLRADPVRDAQLARQALSRVESMLDVKGLQCIDQVQCDSGYVSRAAAYLACERDIGKFSRWASADLDDREMRHNSAIRFWMAVADIAPAIGMVGTIIGLIRLFSDLDDPQNMGGAMALALLTTLYGLILSNLVAAPIAARLLRLSSEELKWQRILTDKLLALARRGEKP